MACIETAMGCRVLSSDCGTLSGGTLSGGTLSGGTLLGGTLPGGKLLGGKLTCERIDRMRAEMESVIRQQALTISQLEEELRHIELVQSTQRRRSSGDSEEPLQTQGSSAEDIEETEGLQVKVTCTYNMQI